MEGTDPSGIRRAEVMAALSLATDLAMGQPIEFALKSCVLGMRLGALLGLGREEMREVYYHSLLRYIGCNAETYSLAALFGDELELRRDFALIDSARAPEVFGMVLRHLRHANAGTPPLEMVWGVLRGLVASKRVSEENIAGHCEVAQRLAERLGFGAGVIRNLGQIYERWDGRGLPQGLKGEAIAPAVRVVTLVQDAIVLTAAHGEEAMLALVGKRSGKTYDPKIADRFLKHSSELMANLEAVSSWEMVLKLEPEPQAEFSETEFDTACLAVADFTDIKSPYAIGHSRKVATLAEEAAKRAGLPEGDAIDLRRAGMLHDLGQVAISARIWVKPGPLTDAEREQVRLHSYYTERVLSRPNELARIGAIAGQHHERCDGSGYHKGTRAQSLSFTGKILAAAECYQAMVEPRPYRAALSAEIAANTLKNEVRAGKLDADAVSAVLAAAGHVLPAKRREFAAGLTAREIDVLRLVARGQSAKEIARVLGLSPKTVDNHIQNVYGKIGVSTRAGATLFAIEHGVSGSGNL